MLRHRLLRNLFYLPYTSIHKCISQNQVIVC
jgi:hypothetical protein